MQIKVSEDQVWLCFCRFVENLEFEQAKISHLCQKKVHELFAPSFGQVDLEQSTSLFFDPPPEGPVLIPLDKYIVLVKKTKVNQYETLAVATLWILTPKLVKLTIVSYHACCIT